MSKQIMSILGPVVPENLGFTSMHEHVLMTGDFMYDLLYNPGARFRHTMLNPYETIGLENISYIRHNCLANYDGNDLPNPHIMKLELEDFKKMGGNSMLDCTALGIRCNLPAIARLSKLTGVNIIESAGFYISCTWPAKYRGLEIRDYYDFMRNEIENGIEDTGYKPGALKVGMDSFNEDETKVLRAAARISRENGMCVTLHGAGQLHKAVEIVKEEGMDPSNFILAHVNNYCFPGNLVEIIRNPGWTFDPSYLQSLLDTGVTLSFEFFGNSIDNEYAGSIGSPDFAIMAYLNYFVEKGYASQIVMGDDICAGMCTRRGGGEGYTRQFHYAQQLMRNHLGYTEEILRTMSYDNPIRLLTHER